ncbi:leucine-rich repeat extensin-like protein 1 [Mangifera indica]|uniref:leucine-rich repeat extensin-like protein 1 n=1 Tax=Mangifera indica TaxID=29780 RepID=UPI001CF94EFA|nr:leucine-rich repeat extensin-like protein 1 [Mangifera indica]
MVPANLLLLLLIWLLVVFNLDFANSREFQFQKHTYDLPSPSTGCVINCTKCPYPCQSLPPPPDSGGYPLYGTPPPPSPGSSYPSYRAPPPPSAPAQRGCPPGPVQCCHYPPPSPPNTYTYIPDANHSPLPYLPPFFFSLVTLSMPFAVLF